MFYDDENDLRKISRIAIDASAFISLGGRMFSGRLKDVSIQSVCLMMEASIPAGTTVDVVIVYKASRAVFRGYVTRTNQGEVVVYGAEKSSASLRSFYAKLAAA